MNKKTKIHILIGFLLSAVLIIGILVEVPSIETVDILDIDQYEDMYDSHNDYDYKIDMSEIKELLGYRIYIGDAMLSAKYGKANPMKFNKSKVEKPTEQGNINTVASQGNDYNQQDNTAIINELMQNQESIFRNVVNGMAKGYNKKNSGIEAVNIAKGLNDHIPHLQMPLDSKFIHKTSSFGVRVDPISKEGTGKIQNKTQEELIREGGLPFHTGVDYAAAGIAGANVYSASHGVVEKIQKSNKGYGNLVIINHGGFKTYYAHLKSTPKTLAVGDLVSGGQTIGYVGSTGRSTGPHLHFEVNFGNVAIDPEILISLVGKGRLLEYVDKDNIINGALTPIIEQKGPLTPLEQIQDEDQLKIEKLFDLDRILNGGNDTEEDSDEENADDEENKENDIEDVEKPEKEIEPEKEIKLIDSEE